MRSRLVQERYPYLVNLNPRIVLSSQGRHLSVVDVVVVGVVGVVNFMVVVFVFVLVAVVVVVTVVVVAVVVVVMTRVKTVVDFPQLLQPNLFSARDWKS